RCTDHQRAIRYSLRQGLEFLRSGKQRRRSHGGTRFTEDQFEGVHYTQVQEAKVAHRARRRADVQRVPRVDQDHTQTIAFVFAAQFLFPESISNLRSEEHTSELQSRGHLVCRLLLEKKNYNYTYDMANILIMNVLITSHKIQ